MKSSNIFLILIPFSLLVYTSCKKFLEEIPKSSITSSNFYKTDKDAEAAVVYAYQDLTSIYGLVYWLMGDFASDNFTLTNAGLGSAESSPFGLFSWTSSTSRIASYWSAHYNSIANVNAALDKIPNINGDTSYLNKLTGELYFLRSLYYFNLVRAFGNVPLILKLQTTNDNLSVSRDDASKVYEQIISDLNLAIEKLPASPLSPGRASKYVAKTLLAEVYLTRASASYGSVADYTQVISLCDDIKENSGYRLAPNYLDLFKSANELKTPESILEAQFSDGVSNLASSTMNQFFLSVNFTSPNSVWQVQPSADLIGNIEPGDKRTILLASDTTLTGFKMTGGKWLTKYQDVEVFGLNINQGANFYVLRYAEVLLMLAEAENEVNGPTSKAIEAVNAIRSRAGLANLTPELTANKNTLRDAILKERRIEFAGEGHRWFDLVRTNRLVSTMQKLGFNGVDDRRNIFPIPLSELDQNPNMTQNDGY